MLTEKVELFLEKYKLLTPKNNIIVAFSGGYDSLCLLSIMKEISKKYDLNLTAIHLNHAWRGEESDLEEYRCREFCKDIAFYSEKLNDDIPHTETAGRQARYDFFEKCAKKFNSKAILTAHNANDNAETIFYRIIKGTGLTGLEGIAEKRDVYYRPLLGIYRKDIETYCKQHKLIPNNDSSNNDTKYARNKIRKEIFPLLKEITPDFEKKLNELALVAKESNQIINAQIKPLEQYKTYEFSNLNICIKNAIVHKFFRENNLDYDKTKVTSLIEKIDKYSKLKSGKKISLTSKLWLFVNSEKMEILTDAKTINNDIQINNEGIYFFDKYKFSIKKAGKVQRDFPKDDEFTALAELKDINFTLRNRKNGDIIQPLGMIGTQKLKKYLTGKAIPKHEKDNLVCLCKDNEVLWVAGYGISDKIKVVNKPTHILKLERDK